MSVWTHVAGCVRFDAIRSFGRDADVHPRTFMGETCAFDDESDVWERCTVPRGSEGSLHYLVDDNKDPSSLAAYRVLIWGDLRDYEDVSEIQAWLERITKGRMVRQCTVLVEVEGGRRIVFVHDDAKIRGIEFEKEPR